jgi:hypothetical protein
MKGGTDASILYEMPGQEGNKRPEAGDHEKRETGNPGRMPLMQNQNVQDRERLVRKGD